MAKIDDGFPTYVNIYEDDTESDQIAASFFWEKSVTPPGMDGGGGNNTTTMRNTRYRTFAPKKLCTLTEFSMTIAYDPEIYTALLDILQQNAWFVVVFSDGSRYGFWAFVDGVEAQEITEGSQPEMEMKCVPTNQDLDGVEAAPVYTPPSS